jgi:hypothetical protein
MNLSAMVGVVIEEVAYGYRRFLRILLALIVLIAKRSAQELKLQFVKEVLNTGIEFASSPSQLVKFGKQNTIERRRFVPGSLKSGHPDPVAEQEMIQKALDAAKRTVARFSVLCGFKERASFEEPFVCDSIVAGEKSKMGEEIHLFGIM